LLSEELQRMKKVGNFILLILLNNPQLSQFLLNRIPNCPSI